MSNTATLSRPRSDNGKNVLIALLVAGIIAFGAGFHFGEIEMTKIKGPVMAPASVSTPAQPAQQAQPQAGK